jgi:regulator of sigma E protease
MTILIFILILVVLIVGHEFGHFVVAKLSGMKVPEFGIGFPPKLWGKKIGDTEYTVNALPFGGFVRIEGEDVTAASEDPAAFSNRPKLLQAATLVAGPFSNFILAFLFFSVAFMAGVPTALEGNTSHDTLQNPRVVVSDVLPKSPAALSGLEAGDQIISISRNGVPVTITAPEQISPAIAEANGPVSVSVIRNGNALSFDVTPKPGLIPEEPNRPAIGVASALVGTLQLDPLSAFARGAVYTVQKSKEIFFGLLSLIKSAVTLSPEIQNVAGPVGIASLAGEAARFGFGSLLSFAAMISLNLGVLNLLPFPALDGGRLAFVVVEAITRRRVPPSFANAVNFVGFAFLILLMLAVTAHDIVRLVT